VGARSPALVNYGATLGVIRNNLYIGLLCAMRQG
jgi:hypothetical protein